MHGGGESGGSVGLKTVASGARVDGGGVSSVHGGVSQVLTMIRSVISEGHMTAKRGAIEELGCHITEAMPSTRAQKVVGKPAKRVKVAEEVGASNEPTEEDAGEEELLALEGADEETEEAEQEEEVEKREGDGKQTAAKGK